MIGARRFLRWLLEVPPDKAHLPPPDPGPAVLELEPVYANGATGALVRFELEPGVDTRVPVPAGAVAFRVRGGIHRAGIYAGASVIAEKPNEVSAEEIIRHLEESAEAVRFGGIRRRP